MTSVCTIIYISGVITSSYPLIHLSQANDYPRCSEPGWVHTLPLSVPVAFVVEIIAVRASQVWQLQHKITDNFSQIYQCFLQLQGLSAHKLHVFYWWVQKPMWVIGWWLTEPASVCCWAKCLGWCWHENECQQTPPACQYLHQGQGQTTTIFITNCVQDRKFWKDMCRSKIQRVTF